MSIGVSVHLDSTKMVTLGQWRDAIERCGYSLEFLEDFEPLDSAGCISCRYNSEPAEIEYYFDTAPEMPQPPGMSIANRAIAEFVVRTIHGEAALLAAIAGAASLCIATEGVIVEDDSGISGPEVMPWAADYLGGDGALAQKAIAFPHPDSDEAAEQLPNSDLSFHQLTQLLYNCESSAKQMLFKSYKFDPFGMCMTTSNQIEKLNAPIGSKKLAPAELYLALQESVTSSVAGGNLIAFALTCKVTIPGELSPPFPDGIRIHVEAPGFSRFVYVPFRVRSYPALRKFLAVLSPIQYAAPIAVDTDASVFPSE